MQKKELLPPVSAATPAACHHHTTAATTAASDNSDSPASALPCTTLRQHQRGYATANTELSHLSLPVLICLYVYFVC